MSTICDLSVYRVKNAVHVVCRSGNSRKMCEFCKQVHTRFLTLVVAIVAHLFMVVTLMASIGEAMLLPKLHRLGVCIAWVLLLIQIMVVPSRWDTS